MVRAQKEKSDTVTILEKVGHFLDEENNRIYNKYSDSLSKKDISLKMKEVIWIALGVGLILTLAYPLAGSLLRFSSIDKEILEVTFGYLSALSIGATAIVLFTALRCFSEGITQTRPVFLGGFHWDVSKYSIRYYFG